jgi:hypothetical protein
VLDGFVDYLAIGVGGGVQRRVGDRGGGWVLDGCADCPAGGVCCGVQCSADKWLG